MPTERILSLINEAAVLGLEELHFLGGEPTLREDLGVMIGHAASLGLSTRVITNGMLLDRPRLRALADQGLGELMVSVDGLEATHNRLRRAAPHGWKKTLRCVEESVSLGLRTRISTVAYEDNYDEVVPLLRLSDALGVQVYSAFLGSPLGRGHGMLGRVITPHRWRALQDAVADELAGLRPNLDVVMEQGFAWTDALPIDRAQLKGRGTGCNTLLEDYDYLIVRGDGHLYQCVFFMTEGRPIGNVRSQALEPTLQYALERREYEAFTVPQDRCSSCTHQNQCGTGCRGYAYLYTGDWLKTDPRCSKTYPLAVEPPPYFPICPIMKLNLRTGHHGGSSEQALGR
jgi:pyrroloquinoline quinone biosynthesis protein E